jgi:hypothetical protein
MIGDPYATSDELKDYLKLTDSGSTYDARLTDAVNTASREIERLCNRQFNKDTSATARVYVPKDWRHVNVDDFWTTSGFILETDSTGDGVFENTWSPSDYEIGPLNGIVDGQPGWPYWRILSVWNKILPVNCLGRRATVQVTAQWGWPSVPAPVHQACLIMAAETYELKSAPLGVAGFGDFGVVRVRTNPIAMNKLRPYRKNPVLVG